MTAPALVPVLRVASSWQQEVARRRKVSGVDPVADALDYCAAELLDAVKEAEAAGGYLTVREYAAKHGRTTATIRRWCRLGRLGAEQLADGGYRIPVAAIPPKTARD